MNCPWLRKPVVACSSVIPLGSIALKRASCCGFFEIFIDSAFGGVTGIVDAVVVFPFPWPAFPLLPVPPPWPLSVVVLDACVPLDGAPDPFAGAEPCVLPPSLPCVLLPPALPLPALPCDTVVVGAFGAFGPPPLPFP